MPCCNINLIQTTEFPDGFMMGERHCDLWRRPDRYPIPVIHLAHTLHDISYSSVFRKDAHILHILLYRRTFLNFLSTPSTFRLIMMFVYPIPTATFLCASFIPKVGFGLYFNASFVVIPLFHLLHQ